MPIHRDSSGLVCEVTVAVIRRRLSDWMWAPYWELPPDGRFLAPMVSEIHGSGFRTRREAVAHAKQQGAKSIKFE